MSRFAYLIDLVVCLVVVLIILLHQDVETQKWSLDWAKLLRFSPLFIIYILLDLFFLLRKEKVKSGVRLVVRSLALAAVFAVVWTFLFPYLPPTLEEKHHIEKDHHGERMNPAPAPPDRTLQWGEDATGEQFAPPPPPPPDGKHLPPPHLRPKSPGFYVQHGLLFFVLGLIPVAFCCAIHLIFLMAQVRKERAENEYLQGQAELKILKYQINPHFLMNALNNIHAQIEFDGPGAQESVRMLSKLMRYMLHDAASERVELHKEVEYLRTYVEIMRRRYIDAVDITLDLSQGLPSVMIPPLLFINLVENAFKHGVSYNHDSFVHISVKVENGYVVCCVRNSRFPSETPSDEKSGLGLDALRKRLDLLYANKYVYESQVTDSDYFVELRIPIEL